MGRGGGWIFSEPTLKALGDFGWEMLGLFIVSLLGSYTCFASEESNML